VSETRLLRDRNLYVIFGVAQGVNIPSIQTSIAGMAPFEYRAAFMSINATIIRMGQAVGPLVIGLFYIYAGFEGTFYGTAALALLAPIVALVVGRAMKLKRT
jgi:ACDE family multidrug resistance protein